MSDPLADFFAKKDKKKSTRKSGAKGDESKSKEREKSMRAGLMSRVLQTEDDGEWADYDEPTEKDYSNLKIQTLTVKDREEEFREQKELEARLAREALEQQTGGPWVRKNLESVEPKDEIKASEDKAETAEKEAKSEEPITPAAPAKYIPPSQRMSMAAASSSTYAPPSRRNKAAPEIKNESEFPTLGGLKAK